jgi:hypothetical protein
VHSLCLLEKSIRENPVRIDMKITAHCDLAHVLSIFDA